MRELFRFLFECLTDPLSIPVNPIAELIILAVINEIVYRIALDIVRKMYRFQLISGQLSGSFFHWLFRGISFVVIWAVVNLLIVVYQFVIEYWIVLLAGTGSVLLMVLCGFLLYHLVIQKQLLTAHKTTNT